MLKVLLVEDDRDFNFLFSKMLSKTFNCKVESAYNGLDGLSKLGGERPDIIFLDVNMPVLNGIEMLEILRSDPDYKKIPVIMLTAINDKEAVRKIASMGITEYLLKPILYAETKIRLTEIFEALKKDMRRPEENRLTVEPVRTGLKVLMIDKDRKLRLEVRKKLDSLINFIDADNGVDGLRLFYKMQPEITLLGENIGLINEIKLVKKIKSIDQYDKFSVIYITSEEVNGESAHFFDRQVIKHAEYHETASEISSMVSFMLRI